MELMHEKWPRFQSLARAGLWRLLWLGPFYMSAGMRSQRSLLGVARPEADRKQKDSFPHTATRLVHLTAGDLPGMQAGTLFRDGRPLISYSRLEERRFTVDFSRQSPFRIGEAPPGSHNLVLPRSAYALGGAWPPMARSGCVGLAQGNDPYAVCVPLAEVLRWCWGSSSRMLQSVLSHQLAELLPNLTLEPESSREGQLPRVRLTLPEGFVPQDAPTLAWLLHNAHARRTALEVEGNLAAGMLRATPPEAGAGVVGQPSSEETPLPPGAYPSVLSHPLARFPHTGTHILTVQGRPVQVAFEGGRELETRERFLVYRITSLDFRLPFEVSIPQLAPSYTLTPSETVHRRSLPPADASRSEVDSSRDPHRQGRAAQLPAHASQFSDAPIRRHRISGTLTTPTRILGTPTPSGPFSTGLGSDSNSPASPIVLTRPPTPPVPPRSEPWPPVSSELFRMLEEALRCLEAVGYTWTSLPLNNPGGSQARFTNLLRPDATPLRCLVIALEYQEQPQHRAYLLEKERIGKEYGPLLLALPTEDAIPGEESLEELLETRAYRTTWPQTHPGFQLVHLAHGFSSVQTFAGGILRALGFPEDAPSPKTSTPLPSSALRDEADTTLEGNVEHPGESEDA